MTVHYGMMCVARGGCSIPTGKLKLTSLPVAVTLYECQEKVPHS